MEDKRYKISNETSRRLVSTQSEKKDENKENKTNRKVSPDRFKNLEMDK